MWRRRLKLSLKMKKTCDQVNTAVLFTTKKKCRALVTVYILFAFSIIWVTEYDVHFIFLFTILGACICIRPGPDETDAFWLANIITKHRERDNSFARIVGADKRWLTDEFARIHWLVVYIYMYLFNITF